jgi:hypothetical protein
MKILRSFLFLNIALLSWSISSATDLNNEGFQQPIVPVLISTEQSPQVLLNKLITDERSCENLKLHISYRDSRKLHSKIYFDKSIAEYCDLPDFMTIPLTRNVSQQDNGLVINRRNMLGWDDINSAGLQLYITYSLSNNPEKTHLISQSLLENRRERLNFNNIEKIVIKLLDVAISAKNTNRLEFYTYSKVLMKNGDFYEFTNAPKPGQGGFGYSSGYTLLIDNTTTNDTNVSSLLTVINLE